jgi:hypothetical protein
MPYFKNNDVNILFIHIPKTGGSSLETYFSNKYNIPLNEESLYMMSTKLSLTSSLQHITYETIMKYKELLNIDMDGIKIITIVRNPYERIINDLCFLNKMNINNTKEEIFDIIKQYLTSNDLDNHNIPQYMFITNEEKEIIPNIHILHTESLTNDMHELGYCDFAEYQNVNTKLKGNYISNYLNDDSIKLLNDFYEDDFRLFHYTKIIV